MLNTIVSFIILLIMRTVRIACADRLTHTHTQENYCYVHCACAPRVNNNNNNNNNEDIIILVMIMVMIYSMSGTTIITDSFWILLINTGLKFNYPIQLSVEDWSRTYRVSLSFLLS